MSRNHWVVGLVVSLFLLLGIGWLFSQYKQVEEEIWTGLKGPAKQQEYYIAGEFLKKKGISLTSKKTFSDLFPLPDNDTMILISSDRKTFSEAQTSELLAWVENGGDLVLAVSEENEQTFTDHSLNSTPVLTAAGIMVTVCDGEDCHLCYEQDNDGEDKSDETSFKVGAEVLVVNEGHGYDFTTAETTLVEKNFVNANCHGRLMSYFQLGNGGITLYSNDSYIFSDYYFSAFSGTSAGIKRKSQEGAQIMAYNHATYLYYLLSQNGVPAKVLWFEAENYPSLWVLFKQHGRMILLVGLLLLFAWAWRSFSRFGSLVVTDMTKSLSLSAHIHATGNFYYNTTAKAKLVQACYEQLDSDIERVLPFGKKLSKAQLATKIAEKIGVKEQLVLAVLERHYPETDIAFTQLIYNIELIRKKL